jgi:hypothetical protein
LTGRLAVLVLLGALLALPAAAGVGGHYLPQTGDRFNYYETVVLNGGIGNYSGYSEKTYVNGTVGVTGVTPNGTESASYQNSDSWSNRTSSGPGSSERWNSAGNFTFSAGSFLYVAGTDNQTGYTNPSVWFYMNNSLATGASFFLLDTSFTVVSRDYSYNLSGYGNVETISAQATGTYQRNDVYGTFTADYTWQPHFDPATGYIVGDLYVEHDSDGSGNGFTWTDQLYVTHTTYPLTPAAASASSSPSSISLGTILFAVVVVIILIAVVAWLVSRSRGRPRALPQHAAPGTIGYGPPPPPYVPTGVAPPIHLTPPGQPVPQVVLRETVKVQCRYCGSLIDVTDKACPNCGAPLV